MNGKQKLSSSFGFEFRERDDDRCFEFRYKQHEDTFELAIESFINNMSSAEKYDFISIANGLESRKLILN